MLSLPGIMAALVIAHLIGYAGISLERTGLLSGTRGQRIAGRFGMVRTGPFGQNQRRPEPASARTSSGPR
ncbi:hypothetical protein JK364_53675 [Streptomyces sp. 110]|uniref:Uncharacterized protein n=1 Tax=Streptomyces endocoffeicus TaxID=2898945 RepID=A0ABS1Q8N7_9ACTN|nr:hypothetical protein [Streptomyces endocoffeicus]